MNDIDFYWNSQAFKVVGKKNIFIYSGQGGQGNNEITIEVRKETTIFFYLYSILKNGLTSLTNNMMNSCG